MGHPCFIETASFNLNGYISAIQIHNTNVKAYYRQVLALKAQNRLQDALNVAQKGFTIKQGVGTDTSSYEHFSLKS